jgi:hypothetical protein
MFVPPAPNRRDGARSFPVATLAFVGFSWDQRLDRTSEWNVIRRGKAFYLQFRFVGGDGFEPPTPAL